MAFNWVVLFRWLIANTGVRLIQSLTSFWFSSRATLHISEKQESNPLCAALSKISRNFYILLEKNKQTNKQRSMIVKLWTYEVHMFELRNEEINVKKILAVINGDQFNDLLPVGLLAQLVRTLHRYRRGQGSNPGKPDFFRLSFRNTA